MPARTRSNVFAVPKGACRFLQLALSLACLVQLLPICHSANAQTAAGPYANGELFGKKFTLEKAFYNSRRLYLRSVPVPVLGDITATQAKPGIRIVFATNQRLEGKSFKVDSGQEKVLVGEGYQPKPKLELDYIAGGSELSYLDSIADKSPYKMTLNFYKQQNGLQPGFIDLEIFCPQPTKIKGYFWAAPE